MILAPHFTRTWLRRSLLVWVVLRGAATAGSQEIAAALGVPAHAHPLRLSPYAALLLIGFVTAAGWIYARRHNEIRFLLCLGYSRAQLLAAHALPVAAVEVVLAVVTRL